MALLRTSVWLLVCGVIIVIATTAIGHSFTDGAANLNSPVSFVRWMAFGLGMGSLLIMVSTLVFLAGAISGFLGPSGYGKLAKWRVLFLLAFSIPATVAVSYAIVGMGLMFVLAPYLYVQCDEVLISPSKAIPGVALLEGRGGVMVIGTAIYFIGGFVLLILSGDLSMSSGKIVDKPTTQPVDSKTPFAMQQAGAVGSDFTRVNGRDGGGVSMEKL